MFFIKGRTYRSVGVGFHSFLSRMDDNLELYLLSVTLWAMGIIKLKIMVKYLDDKTRIKFGFSIRYFGRLFRIQNRVGFLRWEDVWIKYPESDNPEKEMKQYVAIFKLTQGKTVASDI